MGPTGDMDDFMNHSCNPNAALIIPTEKQPILGVVFVNFVALSDIEVGDEITWDYSTTMYQDDWEIDCRCGSRNCRKRIREFRYLPADVQQKYILMGIVAAYILRGMDIE